MQYTPPTTNTTINTFHDLKVSNYDDLIRVLNLTNPEGGINIKHIEVDDGLRARKYLILEERHRNGIKQVVREGVNFE